MKRTITGSQFGGSDNKGIAALDDAVRAEQIRMLMHRRVDLPMNLLLAAIVWVTLQHLYPGWIALSWLGLFCLVILARLVLRRAYGKDISAAVITLTWGRAFALSAFATALLWGLTGSAILMTPNPVYHVFIVFVLGGLTAAGIVSNSAYLPAMWSFILPTALPVIFIFSARHDISHIELAVMMVMFALVLIASGRNINRSIAENFRLRIEQDMLSKQLSASETAMREAQEIAQVGSWEIDLVQKSYFCSSEALRVFGFDPEKDRPSLDTMLARVHPEDRWMVDKHISEAMASERGRGIDHRLVMDDGTTKYVHELARVTRDAEGRALRMIGTVQDITERKIAENKLQFTNILLKTETEASPNGILVLDVHRKVISFNHRYADIWRIPVADLTMADDAVLLSKVTSQQKDPQGFRARVKYFDDHPDESGRDALETIDGRFVDRETVPLTTSANEYLGRVWFFRDVTEQRKAADALIYRDRLLRALTVGTGILINAESIDQGMPEALHVIGEAMAVDRVLVVKNSSDGTLTLPAAAYRWESPGAAVTFNLSTPEIEALKLNADEMVAWLAPLKTGKPLIAQLKTSTGSVRSMLEAFHNKSLLMVSINVGGEYWGTLGIDACTTAREWTASEIYALETLASSIGTLIQRNRTRLLLESSEERFRVLNATAEDAIFLIDGAGRISSWNRAAERILGYSAEDAIGRVAHEFLAPGNLPGNPDAVLKTFITTGTGDLSGKTSEVTVVRKDGAEIAVELSLAGAKINDQWEAIGILRDVTARKAAEENLRFANILLTTETEASPDGILVVDANRKIISSNARFSEIWKTPRAVLAAGNDENVLAAGTSLVKDPQKFTDVVKRIYEHPGESSHDEFEMTDGRFMERHTVMLKSSAGQYLGRIWFFRDITASKRAAAHALRLARFDVLTGLANRSVFVEALQHAVARAKRTEKGFAVIYLDLDHFKDVNETLGHPAGDALLQAVADRLESNTRESDTVARFGGDEFAIIVADVVEPSDVAILAQKLIHALGQPYSIQGNEVFSAASAGIDLYGPEAADAETLLSHADMALYRAKGEGRDVYRFFTPAMDKEVRMQVSLGTELHEALDAGQLFLVYQPQVAIDSARVVGLEALVRWHHPRRGIIGPEVLIPIAEKMGMIVKLGHWVLLTACRQTRKWLDAGIAPTRVAVNLSAQQFKSPIGLEADIADVLAETGLPPQLLELELTETILMDVSRDHSDIVARLRKIGVTIAIDDFGAGFSSLDYLRRFPADHIKIAQNFVRNLETAPSDAIIVKATIGLARELGIPTITEGVETRKQFELLKSWGCREVQGFYFSKPLAVDDVTRMLGSGNALLPGADSVSPPAAAHAGAGLT